MTVIWFYINWKEENYLSDRGYWKLVGTVKIKSEPAHCEEEPEIQVLGGGRGRDHHGLSAVLTEYLVCVR